MDTMKPVMITLNQIKSHSPCDDGWEKILAARGGDAADYDAEFPLADALDSNSASDVIWALRCVKIHDRMLQRFAAWCARQVAHLNPDPRVMAAIEAAERFSDDPSDENRAAALAARAAALAARAAARAAADAAALAAALAAAHAAAHAARAAADAAAHAAALAAHAAAFAAHAAALAAHAAARAAHAALAADAAARRSQSAKLRQILTAGEWVEDAP